MSGRFIVDLPVLMWRLNLGVLKNVVLSLLRATEDIRVVGSAAISRSLSTNELRLPQPRETRGFAMTHSRVYQHSYLCWSQISTHAVTVALMDYHDRSYPNKSVLTEWSFIYGEFPLRRGSFLPLFGVDLVTLL